MQIPGVPLLFMLVVVAAAVMVRGTALLAVPFLAAAQHLQLLQLEHTQVAWTAVSGAAAAAALVATTAAAAAAWASMLHAWVACCWAVALPATLLHRSRL